MHDDKEQTADELIEECWLDAMRQQLLKSPPEGRARWLATWKEIVDFGERHRGEPDFKRQMLRKFPDCGAEYMFTVLSDDDCFATLQAVVKMMETLRDDLKEGLMGSLTRVKRNERFINEFEKEIIEHYALQIGTALTVTEIYAAEVRPSEETHLMIKLTDAAGTSHEMDAGMLFDPESREPLDVVKGLANYGISDRAAIRERLIKAQLFKDGNFDN